MVCGCGRRDYFTSPVNWVEGDEKFGRYKLNFPWWVCGVCLKPAPMNALNARLIRECEMCEDAYFINHYPDRMNCCEACA